MENFKDNLRIIIIDSAEDLGKKINQNIKLIRHNDFDYTIPVSIPRFSNSEAKAKVLESVRGKDLFILTDVSNYDVRYKMYGEFNRKSCDDHYQDLKRVISATAGTAERVWAIMPLLYESRQHKREGRESLDCAMALHELEFHGVKGIITCDAHDPSVRNALHSTSFDNIFPTNTMLNQFINKEDIDFNDLVVVNPDAGATKRASYFASLLQSPAGGFRKVRDLSKVVDGTCKIESHQYEGSVPLENKNVIIVDDMISSGGSMISTAKTAKELNAKSVYIFTTFALFSDGIKSVELFNKAYKEGLFDKIYATNLSYVPEYIKTLPWYEEVDCSNQLAQVIHTLNINDSIEPLMNGKEEVMDKVLVKKNQYHY